MPCVVCGGVQPLCVSVMYTRGVSVQLEHDMSCRCDVWWCCVCQNVYHVAWCQFMDCVVMPHVICTHMLGACACVWWCVCNHTLCHHTLCNTSRMSVPPEYASYACTSHTNWHVQFATMYVLALIQYIIQCTTHCTHSIPHCATYGNSTHQHVTTLMHIVKQPHPHHTHAPTITCTHNPHHTPHIHTIILCNHNTHTHTHWPVCAQFNTHAHTSTTLHNSHQPHTQPCTQHTPDYHINTHCTVPPHVRVQHNVHVHIPHNVDIHTTPTTHHNHIATPY